MQISPTNVHSFNPFSTLVRSGESQSESSTPSLEVYLKEFPALTFEQAIVLAAHAFGGPYISGMKIGETLLEKATFAQIAHPLVVYLQTKAAQQQDGAFLKEMIDALQGLIEIDTKASSLNADTEAGKFAPWLTPKLKALEPNKRLLIPAGWVGRKDMSGKEENGHAMLFELLRQSDGRFTLTVINTGRGLETFHSSKVVGYKEKRSPLLTFANLPESLVCNPESWHIYFSILYRPVKQGYPAHKPEEIYQQLLPCFGVTLAEQDKKFEKESSCEPLTPQRSDTGALDALLAYLRWKSPNPVSHKKLKLEFKYAVWHRLVQFKESESLPERRAYLELLRLCTQNYAFSVNKALQKGSLSVQEAQWYEARFGSVLESITALLKADKIAFEKSEIDFAKFLEKADSDPYFRTLPYYIDEQARALPRGTVRADKFAWPSDPAKLQEKLQIFMKVVGAPQKEEELTEMNAMLGYLFTSMPSVANNLWDKIPPHHVEGCMLALVALSEKYFTSCSNMQRTDCCYLTPIYQMQKVLAVVKKLSLSIPELAPIVLNTSYFPHPTDLSPVVNGLLMVHDPVVDRELAETLQFFADPKNGNVKGGFFGEDLYTCIHRDQPLWRLGAADLEALAKRSDDSILPQTVESYVYEYVKKREHIRKKIVETIQSKLNERFPGRPITITEHLILSIALKDGKGEFLPPAFCALRTQAYMTQLMCRFYLPVNFKNFKCNELIVTDMMEYAERPEATQLNVHMTLAAMEDTAIHKPYPEQTLYRPLRNRDKAAFLCFNNDALNLTHNQIVLCSSSEVSKPEMNLLRSIEDKSQQAVKTIAFYRTNFGLLADPEDQVLFQALMFERGVLRQQLQDHPGFAQTLAEFVEEGLSYSLIRVDVQQYLFFLRMGDLFLLFCKDANLLAPDVKFPDLQQKSEKLLTFKGLSAVQESLILREQLASFKRQGNPLTYPLSITLLKKALRLKELGHSQKLLDEPHLDPFIFLLLRDIALLVRGLPDKQHGELFSEVTGEKAAWKLEGTLASGTDKTGKVRLHFDLLTGTLYKSGGVATILPEIPAEEFQEAFGQQKMTEVRDVRTRSPFDYTFVDSSGYLCRVFKQHQRARWEFFKCIDDKWCVKYDRDLSRVLGSISKFQNCNCWQTAQQESVNLYFLDSDSGQLRYTYDGTTHVFTSLTPGVTHNLSLVEKEFKDNNEVGRLFSAFDNTVLFWKNSEHRMMAIECPKFQLTFKVDWSHGKCRIEGPVPFQNYHVAKQQKLDSLRKLTGYIVLENDQSNDKIALVPNLWHDHGGKYAKEYFTFALDRHGRLRNDEDAHAQLYLAYQQYLMHDYARVSKTFRSALIKVRRPLEERESYFVTAWFLKHAHDNPRIQAVRLLVDHFMRDQALRHPPQYRSTTQYDFNKEMGGYLSQLTHLPEGSLSQEEESALLTSGRKSWPTAIVQRRLYALGLGSISEREAKKERESKEEQAVARPILMPFPSKDRFNIDHYLGCCEKPKPLEFPHPLINTQWLWVIQNFLKLYPLVKNGSYENAERNRVVTILLAGDPKSEFYTSAVEREQALALRTVLLAAFLHPNEMPTAQELFDAFLITVEGGKEKLSDKSKYKENSGKIADYLEKLYQKAQTLVQFRSFAPLETTYGALPEKVSSTPFQPSPIQPQAVLELPPIYSNALFGRNEETYKSFSSQEVAALEREWSAFSKKKASMPPEKHDALRLEELRLLRKKREHDYLTVWNRTIASTKPLFVKAEREQKQHTEKAALVDKLKQAEQEQKNRVERRIIRELCEDVGTAIQRIGASQDWMLNEEALPHFETALKEQWQQTKALLKGLRIQIEKLANKRPADPKQAVAYSLAECGDARRMLSVDDLLLPYVRYDAAEYQKLNPLLTAEEANALHFEIEEYLIVATRLEQMRRVEKKVADYKQAKPHSSQEMLRQRSQDILETLTAKRNYLPSEFPYCLVFEQQHKLLLRSEQIDSIRRLAGKTDCALQLAMGAGKTDVLAPLLAYIKADGDRLSLFMVPEELLEMVNARLSMRSGVAFNQVANRINWKELEETEGPQFVLRRLESIRKNREFLIVTDREIHGFNLLVERTRTALCYQKLIQPEDFSKLQILLQIKELLKSKGSVVIDEAHKIFYCRQDSRFAIDGNGQNKVNPSYVKIAAVWFLQLLTHPKLKEAAKFDFWGRSEAAKPFSVSDYSNFKVDLIQATLEELAKTDNKLREAISGEARHGIIRYLAATPGDKVSLPATCGEELSNRLAFLRSEVLISPSTWNSMANMRYGFFMEKEKPSLLAGPFESAFKPKEGSQFANLTELMNYTVQIYLASGLPSHLLHAQLKRIQSSVQKEMIFTGTRNPFETGAYQEYVALGGERWAKEAVLFELGDKSIEDLRVLISTTPALLLNFLERYVLSQTPIYERTLISDAQQLASLFAHAVAFTGTPTKDTLPDRFDFVSDAGADGRVLYLLHKNSLTNVHFLQEEQDGYKILKEMMLQLEKTPFRSILDAGALFKDIPQRLLAEKVLELRLDVNAVIFFENNQQMLMMRDPRIVVPASHMNISPADRFTIYDQSHCIGTDIVQMPTAHACLTMHKNLTYKEASQAASRMRGIGTGQIIHLFLTPSQQELVKTSFGKREITDILDPLLYMCKVQGSLHSDDNIVTIRQKLRNLVVQFCQNILDRTSLLLLNEPIYRDLNEILITTTPDSPFKLYGNVDGLIDSENALKHFKQQIQKPLTDWLVKYNQVQVHAAKFVQLQKEMNKVVAAALQREAEKVNEWIPVGSSPDKDQEVSMSVAVNVDQAQNTDRNMDVAAQYYLSFSKQSKGNPCQAPALSVQNMFFQSSWKPTNIEGLRKEASVAPLIVERLFSVVDSSSRSIVCANDLFSLLTRLPQQREIFHPNIFMSIDLISTEKQGKPLGIAPKPMGPCLILQSKADPKKTSLVLVSGQEAEKFKRALLQERTQSPDRDLRVCLLYLGLGAKLDQQIYQQGSDPVDPRSLETAEFQLQLLQARFLSGDITVTKEDSLLYKKWLENHPQLGEIRKFFETHLIVAETVRKSYPESFLCQKILQAK